MRHLIICVAVLALAGCAKKENSQDEFASRAPMMEDLINCVAFYDAYGTYLKPYYPEQAASYKAFADQHVMTAVMLQSPLVPNNTGTPQEKLQRGAMAYQQRLVTWDGQLKAAPDAANRQASYCNTQAPSLNVMSQEMTNITQGLRTNPQMMSVIQWLESYRAARTVQ